MNLKSKLLLKVYQWAMQWKEIDANTEEKKQDKTNLINFYQDQCRYYKGE